MRIAFLSDIHANFPALCRALEVAQAHQAERVICAGDIVGEGPHPTEVVRLLMEQGIPSIRGNVDRKVLALLENPKKLERRLEKKGQAAAAWAALALGEAERAWLASLPGDLRLDLGGAEAWVVHGSPVSDADYIFPSITAPALARKLGDEHPRALICGHSHIPFTREIGGVRVVNCGSVGRPVDGDPRGALALCDVVDQAKLRCRILRFPYPVEAVMADVQARGARGVEPLDYQTGTKPKAT